MKSRRDHKSDHDQKDPQGIADAGRVQPVQDKFKPRHSDDGHRKCGYSGKKKDRGELELNPCKHYFFSPLVINR